MRQVPEVMFDCPTTKKPIGLGLYVDPVSFATFNHVVDVACPHCGSTHRATKANSYLAQA